MLRTFWLQRDVAEPSAWRPNPMNFTPDDLTPIDPIEHVRSNPEMYMGRSDPDPAAIADTIAQGSLVLGASETKVTRFGRWWIISADVDWLSVPCSCTASPIETFNRLLAFPELAVNSFRHETLATAFAQCVVSLSHTDRFVVSGDITEDNAVWNEMYLQNMMRSVAFRMAS